MSDKELRERVAKAIYDAMRENDPEGSRKPWVPNGNSIKQEEARSRADAALASSDPSPERERLDVAAGDYIEDTPGAWAAFVTLFARYASQWDPMTAHLGEGGAGAAEVLAGAMLSALASEHGLYLRAASGEPSTPEEPRYPLALNTDLAGDETSPPGAPR